MNRQALLSLSLIACLSCTCFKSQAQAQTVDTKVAARKVLDTNQPMVFSIKSMVNIEATMKGKQVLNREMPAYGTGTVISDGMLVTSYRTVKPNAGSSIPGLERLKAQGLKLVTEVKEVKLIDESGEEFAAKLVLHDEDLDLAFIALDRSSDNAGSWSCQPVDISSDTELAHLDDVVYLSRAGESMRFQPSIRVGEVHTIIKRPRQLYATSSLVAGGAAFSADGKFVGIGIRKASDAGGQFSAVLPAKYIRKLLPQAIEKAANVEQEEEKEKEIAAESDAATDGAATATADKPAVEKAVEEGKSENADH